VDEALGAQLIEAGESLDTYAFGHALVRQTLYESLNPSRQVRLHRRVAEGIERVYGERASEHAAEIAYHYRRSASLPGAERGVVHALMAADRAAAWAHNDVVALLRTALELLPLTDERRPRLLARFAIALSRALQFEESVHVATEAGDLIARTEGNDAAADFLAEAAIALYGAGAPRSAWAAASEGLRYVGARRDVTWARLMTYDIVRREAEAGGNPGIVIDTPERRAVSAVIEAVPLGRDEFFVFGVHGFIRGKSRQDILERFAENPYYLMAGAGEYRRSVPIWERWIAQYKREGRIADVIESLAHLGRCHNALGALAAARAVFEEGVALTERLVGGLPPRNQPLAMTRYEMRLVEDDRWGEYAREVAEEPPMVEASSSTFAAVRAMAAWYCARTGQAEQALFFLESILDPLERAPGWVITYDLVAFHAAGTLWLLERTDHVEVIERNLREKILAPDFRHPMADARLSLAHLSALQGRDDEAMEWFAAARTVLDEQGARPLRAIVDFDEALMYQRRGAPERARPLFETALEQFRTIDMPGWIRRAERLLTTSGDRSPVANAEQSQMGPDIGRQQATVGVETRHTSDQTSANRLCKDGDYWTLTHSGKVIRLKDSKGLQYLARMLRHPGQEFLALDLASGDHGSRGDKGAPGIRDHALPILDSKAKSAYKLRLTELRDELEEAEGANDLGRSERARTEIDLISRELAAAVGLGGNDRITKSVGERARSTVTKGIKSAIAKIRDAHPNAGRYLARTVRTGYFCAYEPDPDDSVWIL
jgi:tetratricopeptide (TPR) repeat protein